MILHKFLFFLLLLMLGCQPSATEQAIRRQLEDYPQSRVQDIYKSFCQDKLGLVDASNKPGGAVFYAKKIFAMLLFGVLLGLLVRYVNGCTTFWCGALTAYALWCVVNWFDAFVLDCIWFCHDKHFVIPGTEDMVAAYHDYWFHIRGGFIGMLLAIPAALVAGLFVIL